MARSDSNGIDYRDITKQGLDKKKEKPEKDTRSTVGNTNYRWWDMMGTKCAESINSAVHFLQRIQEPRVRQAAGHANLYGNIATFVGAGAAASRRLQGLAAQRERITFNATGSIIDTVTARIGETKPRPDFVTSAGDYRQQRLAKKLNRFETGNFFENKTYDLGLDCFRDAGIWGDGFMYVYGYAGKIRHERVIGAELWIDEEEGQYRQPRTLYRVKVVDRDQLAARFPECREKIMQASAPTEAQKATISTISDMVTVVECWRLPTEDQEGKLVGGKHAMALISNGVMLLEPEEYKHPKFPFAKIPWSLRPVGYWSQGICEQLRGEQQELNKELQMVQRSMHLAGMLKVILKAGSKIVKETIDNQIGNTITYAGDTPPQFYCPEPIHQAFFTNPNTIIERMYRLIGVSEMSASSRNPLGPNASGAAFREMEDIESDRFRTISRQNNQFYIDIAELDVMVGRELGGVEVKVSSKLGWENVSIKGADLKNSQFTLQCFPDSRLPKDPAGRMATIQEWVQAGWITPRQARRLMDFPDLDSVESLANAQEELIIKTLDGIIDEGEYAPPEPTDDLSLASEMVLEYIAKFRCMDLEYEKMSMLRQWSAQVDSLKKKAAQQIQAQQAAMTPQAAPQPQPTSPLVQNQPGISKAA